VSDITSEIDYAVANNLWLIILFHRVDETIRAARPLADHTLIQEPLTTGATACSSSHHNEGLIIEI